MKIAGIDVWALRCPIEQPFCFSQGWVFERAATLVEVVTDDGISGWGEALCQGLQPPEVAAAAVRHAFAPMLIGQDPQLPEVHWHAMYNKSRDFGLKGAVIGAISAIDIALWDICGKAEQKPVHALLGGAFRNKVEAYATGFYRIKGRGEAPRLAEEALRHRQNGFRAMKIKLGFGLDDDLAVMAAIREALAGQPAELMIDTNHAYGFATARRLGQALADYGLRWYEEPVTQEDLRGYAALRQVLSMPVAGGENEFTAFGFRSLFEAGAVDIAQPDIASAGGFTGCRHIIALAHAHGVAVNPHVWGSAVSQAASLQLIAAIPTTHHSLFADQPIFEYDQSMHPFRRQLVAEPLEQREGWVEISDKPGLGIEVNREIVQRYASPL